jgi:hypothetical protein
VVERLDKDPRVTVIADPLPQPFCAGYLHPRVYVSRRTVELTKAELDAVLAHEHHHRRVRDPLRLACARILSQALFFVPVLRSLSERYAESAELSEITPRSERTPAKSLRWLRRCSPSIGAGHPGLRGSPLSVWTRYWGSRSTGGYRRGFWPRRSDFLSGMSTLIWLVSGAASAHATFKLPILSSQPCVIVLMTIVLFVVGVCILGRPARLFGAFGTQLRRRIIDAGAKRHPPRRPSS